MKLATIGSGAIVDTMFDAIEQIEGIEPAAVYSRTMERAQEYAARHHVPRAYDDLDAMLADDTIDTVYIASPNNLHYPQAKKALQAGKHVILEKPFTSTKEQAEELFALAEKNNCMIFEAITSLHTPNYGILKESLDRAGRIRQCVFNFSQYSSKYDRYRQGIVTNAFDPAMDGGALADINIYNIHLALGLFGKPEALVYAPVFGINGIDTSGTLLLSYPDFTVTCIGSKDCWADYLYTIQGEDGTFVISKASSGVMKQIDFQPVHPQPDQPAMEQVSIDQGKHMSWEFRDFLSAIEEKDWDRYEKWKAQTLQAAEILDEAKAMRDAILASRQSEQTAG